MQPPPLSSLQRGDSPQKIVCAQRAHDAISALASGHRSASSLPVARATEAAEKARPSTSRVLAGPSRLLGQQQQAPATCQRLQRRGDVDTLPAIGHLQAARRVTNTDWFHPLRALERQRQTAAEAYIPYTIAAAEAEDAQRARLALAPMPLDWGCCEAKYADDLSVQRPSSAKAHRDVDAVIPAQTRLSNVGLLRRLSFVATEPSPRRLLTREPPSRSCRGGGSCFSAAHPTTSRCGASVHTGTKDEMADTLTEKVDAVTPTRESLADMPALPALESAADLDAHLRCISRQYARLDRLLRGYSTPDDHDVVAFRVVPTETPAPLPQEPAPPCLYPQPPPFTSVVRLVVQPSIQLSLHSSLSLGAPFSSFYITPAVQLTRLSATQVQGLPSFASLTAATSGAVSTPLTSANTALRHFRAGKRLPQHPRHWHSVSYQDLSNRHSEHHPTSARTPPYTGAHDARFRRHSACLMEGPFHNLLYHEQHQRSQIDADAHRALSTVRTLHTQYCQYLEVTRSQQKTCETAPEIHEISRLVPRYSSKKIENRQTGNHHHRQLLNFSHPNFTKKPASATHAGAPQEAYEDVEEACRAGAPQEAYEDVEEVGHAGAPQEAYEDVEEVGRAGAPQEAYEGVEESTDAAEPLWGYESCDGVSGVLVWEPGMQRWDDFGVVGMPEFGGDVESGRSAIDCVRKDGYRCGAPEVVYDESGNVVDVCVWFPDLTLDAGAEESGVGEVFTETCGLWRSVVTSSKQLLRGPRWRQHLVSCAPRIRELVIADVSAMLDCSAACVRNVRLYAASAAAASGEIAAVGRMEDDILCIELGIIQEATVALHPLGGVQFLLDSCSFPYLQQWRRSRDQLECKREGVAHGSLSPLSKVAALFTNMEGDERSGRAQGVELQLWAYSTKGAAARFRGRSVVKRLPLPSARVVYQPERRNCSEGSLGSLSYLEQETVLSDPTDGASSGRLVESALRGKVHTCKLPASAHAARGPLPTLPVPSMPLQMATPSGIEEIIKQEKEKARNLIATRPVATPLTVPAETLAMTSQPTEMAGLPKEAVQKANPRGFFSSGKRTHM